MNTLLKISSICFQLGTILWCRNIFSSFLFSPGNWFIDNQLVLSDKSLVLTAVFLPHLFFNCLVLYSHRLVKISYWKSHFFIFSILKVNARVLLILWFESFVQALFIYPKGWVFYHFSWKTFYSLIDFIISKKNPINQPNFPMLHLKLLFLLVTVSWLTRHNPTSSLSF